MPLAQVALAAGFGSVRRFNAVFQKLYQRAPSRFRRGNGEGASDTDSALALTLPFAPPYDWPAMLTALAARAEVGVETIEHGVYRRPISIDGAHGDLEVRLHDGEPSSLKATIRFPIVTALPSIVRRIRRVFDLSADPLVIGAHLSEDPLLAPLVRKRPGLRAPGSWDDPRPTKSSAETAWEHDALDPTDSRLLRAVEQLGGKRLQPQQLLARAERWRPWRAYAAIHLLAATSGFAKAPSCTRIALQERGTPPAARETSRQIVNAR
jgi:AraC family transcriptional regulator of adaptative response / DNA-3-methyladenine glycosylase II